MEEAIETQEPEEVKGEAPPARDYPLIVLAMAKRIGEQVHDGERIILNVYDLGRADERQARERENEFEQGETLVLRLGGGNHFVEYAALVDSRSGNIKWANGEHSIVCLEDLRRPTPEERERHVVLSGIGPADGGR